MCLMKCRYIITKLCSITVTMETQEQLLLALKQEIDTMSNENQCLIENETDNVKIELQNNHMDNSFDNIQLQVKQEHSEPEISNSEMLTSNSGTLILNSELITSNTRIINSNSRIETEITPNITNEGINVKEEVRNNDSLVSYGSPNFDDSVSMDSDDATALGNVEACLQEEFNIKFEIEACEVSYCFSIVIRIFNCLFVDF